MATSLSEIFRLAGTLFVLHNLPSKWSSIVQYLNRILKPIAIAVFLICVVAVTPSQAQVQTVGLFVNDTAAFQGYTLFEPIRTTKTFLIDMYGRVINSWDHSFRPAASVYLLEDGYLLRTNNMGTGGAGAGGGVQKIAWDGTVVWDYTYSSENYRAHHDIEPLSNGNLLILAWDFYSAAEAIAEGRDTALLVDSQLWPESVIEVEPVGADSGNIVWEWHLWDHLVQDYDSTKNNYGVLADHSELMDINFAAHGEDDWIHANAIDYNPQLDQILISCRMQNEFIVIDHSTTTAEAASHSGGNSGMGGDIIYRWGNPIGYGAGTEGDQKLFLQHDAQWIPPGYPGEGNIMVFNNGGLRLYSSVEEIITSVDGNGHYPQPSPGMAHGPAEAIWTYTSDPPDEFYSAIISGATRQPNGNTLICEGLDGRFFEVTPTGEIVWEYINPVNDSGSVVQGDDPGANAVFRCYRYPADYPGLQGKDLTPGGFLEIYPVSISSTSHIPSSPLANDSVFVTSIIADDSGISFAELFVDIGSGFLSILMYDDGNHHDGLAGDSLYGAVIPPYPYLTMVRYYIHAVDNTGGLADDPPAQPVTTYSYVVTPEYVCGNINDDPAGSVDVADLTYLIDYLFRGGSPPPEPGAVDVDGSGGIDVADLTYMADYLFGGGPPPNCW